VHILQGQWPVTLASSAFSLAGAGAEAGGRVNGITPAGCLMAHADYMVGISSPAQHGLAGEVHRSSSSDHVYGCVGLICFPQGKCLVAEKKTFEVHVEPGMKSGSKVVLRYAFKDGPAWWHCRFRLAIRGHGLC
jgi:hypothetical protein